MKHFFSSGFKEEKNLRKTWKLAVHSIQLVKVFPVPCEAVEGEF